MGIGYVIKSFVEERVNAYFKDIPRYIIEVGVFSSDDKNNRMEYETYNKKDGTTGRRKIKLKGSSSYKVSGITNAEIMFIMENGSPTNHIPPRPVLQKTIDYAKKELVEDAIYTGLMNYLLTHNIKDYEKEIEKMCIRMENYAKTGIRRKTLGLAPNSPYTIRKKTINGKVGDIPLLDTGQLANSIKCVFRRL